MENIKNLPETTVEATLSKELYAARTSKSFQDFMKVLSQIIEKHIKLTIPMLVKE